MRFGNGNYNTYRKWIQDEYNKKQIDWDYRSESIRHGKFVAMTEHYFRNH